MKIRKTLSLSLGIVFIIFAIVQYNDPDPWGWILIYLAIGMISLLSAFEIYNKWISYFVLAITVIWMITLFPGLWYWLRNEPLGTLITGMSPDKMYIEESREFLGLLMGSTTLVYVISRFQGRA